MSTQHIVSLEGTPSGVQVFSEESRGSKFDLRRVGDLLRETRERKGLSLNDVSEALFLTKSTLEAIESGHWDILPHPVYVRGYVKSYAYYLDIYKKTEEYLRLSLETLSDNSSMEKSGLPQREDRSTGRLHGVSLKSLALVCSSVVGLAFGTTTSPALQATSSTGLKDALIALQVATISLRRFVLP